MDSDYRGFLTVPRTWGLTCTPKNLSEFQSPSREKKPPDIGRHQRFKYNLRNRLPERFQNMLSSRKTTGGRKALKDLKTCLVRFIL